MGLEQRPVVLHRFWEPVLVWMCNLIIVHKEGLTGLLVSNPNRRPHSEDFENDTWKTRAIKNTRYFALGDEIHNTSEAELKEREIVLSQRGCGYEREGVGSDGRWREGMDVPRVFYCGMPGPAGPTRDGQTIG